MIVETVAAPERYLVINSGINEEAVPNLRMLIKKENVSSFLMYNIFS